ncbi:hypothetical protein [Demequina sp. NBRC 110057]|uniref:hypothetical protein n=1 Tax=Demequina sp. NBRC 110057 TaxID=1570346 RepID=UPI0011785483|nr:hypothetical protein [Demequina sp. NBRC 110057]
MTVPELSIRALRPSPARRATEPASPSAPPADTAWLHEATPTAHDVDHPAPAHAARAHLAPVEHFDARAGVNLVALLIRAAVIAAMVALAYVAITDGWIPSATQALADWWAGDIAPYFAIDIVNESGTSGGSFTAGVG